jgi:hypothetical protein
MNISAILELTNFAPAFSQLAGIKSKLILEPLIFWNHSEKTQKSRHLKPDNRA